MKKRIFATAMCVALIATTLTACGGKNEKNENTTEEVTTVTEESTEATEATKDTEESVQEDTKPAVEDPVDAKDEVSSTSNNDAEDPAVEEVNTVEYEFHGSSTVFPVKDNDNEPYQRLVDAGIADDNIYAGSAIIFADDGTWILYMNGPEDSSIRLSFPGESEDITPEEEWNNLVDVYLSVLAEYKNGTRTAIDVNNDGVIDSTDNEICCYFSCGIPIYGSIWSE